MNLSEKAVQVVKRLEAERESPECGRMALVDPETGEVYFGATGPEALRTARAAKGDRKAAFYAVRVGAEFVHALKVVQMEFVDEGNTRRVEGGLREGLYPVIEAFAGMDGLKIGRGGDIRLLVDTGFSGALALDQTILERLPRDFGYVENIVVAGGARVPSRVFLVTMAVLWNNGLARFLDEVEAVEMAGESLLGISGMKLMGRGLAVDFSGGRVVITE